MATDISEKGFEKIIVDWLVEKNNFELGADNDFDKNYAFDIGRLFKYLESTQPALVEELGLNDSAIERKKFLDKLDCALSDKGIIEILRSGFKYKYRKIELYQYTPSEGNKTSAELYAKNIFSVVRQVHYSSANKNSLDIVIFLNGLPIITIELKNNLTRQNVRDAIRQYQTDRDARDKIFNFKRCIVHFAVDDEEIYFCTKLAGKESFFMPFNKGNNDGAGNPPNGGIKTDYLWKKILTKAELSNILENFVNVVDKVQIFPRLHQLKVVEKLLTLAKSEGVGHRYLIQHSAGSGKSNSIAWLAYQLVKLRANDKKIFDSVIVVTDRVNLDKQIKNTIKNLSQVSSNVGWAKNSAELNNLLQNDKPIIITIVHKFQEVAKKIDEHYKNKNFAVIIDEAHSSQNGSLAAKMNQVISGINPDAADEVEDKINAIVEGKKSAKNASYFAFTATPKNKTLELFGKITADKKYIPHDVYSMRQAIEEGFILDVLKNYTPYKSYYHIVKTSAEEKFFDKKSANKILKRFADSHELAINEKSAIIVEHFYNSVRMKIQGKARAMVVTDGIKSAIKYFFAINREFAERNSQYKAVVAFSGECEFNGEVYTEATLNNFPSSKIEETFRAEPYRILVVADKFQTGYDEPLLQTMYVDKKIFDIKAVQTLSRLNRCAAFKNETCILDFANNPEDIKKSFERYYKTTILSGKTDLKNLDELLNKIFSAEIFSEDEIELAVKIYLADDKREKLDAVLNPCTEKFKLLDIEKQIEFKRDAKFFIRTYNFLSAIMPCNSTAWEKVSIFLTLLLTKLPAVTGEELEDSITENVNLESYRAVAQENLSIALENENSVVNAESISEKISMPELELDTLTKILAEFHKLFGDLQWTHNAETDLQIKNIFEHARADWKVQNAITNSDEQNIRNEISRAVTEAINITLKTNGEIYMAYHGDAKNKLGQQFKSWLNDIIFQNTCVKPRF